VPRRTAHIDVDDVGASGFGDPRAFRHPTDLASGELNDMRADTGCLASQLGHRPLVYEIVARRHFGNDKTSPKGSR
jgi:hypothetical protein